MKWFWDSSSNINAIINIISTVISGVIFIAGLVISVLRLKLKGNQYKYLNLVEIGRAHVELQSQR